MPERTHSGRLRRGERMVVMAYHLLNAPYRLFSLGTFVELLSAAKSTVSEDLSFVRQAFDRFQLGKVETLAGAAGGVRYLPIPGKERMRSLVEELCQRLRDPTRLLPGGFLYTSDLSSTPRYATALGEALAGLFGENRPDVVLTVEVKGIPLALMTARAFDVPLVTIRRGAHVTEGPAVSVNYVSGSSKTVQSMTLPLRAVMPGSKVLFIDDFLRAGGTARGVHDLMREFRAEVIGIGVFIETTAPRQKMIDRYVSLIEFGGVNDRGEILVSPSRWL
ncbi:MAG: pur operon repressor [Armatimonadetes bacterium 13_1_40CM_64_14]|nr:MAG: pur operon repressor [Armatimonadetes bacterium 13_1_40CM_64_14]